MAQKICDPRGPDCPGYVDLVRSVMKRNGVSSRELQRRTALSRHRLRAIVGSGDMTETEQEIMFAKLEIEPHCAFLAIKRLRDPEAYFSAVISTTADFSEYLAHELTAEAAARLGDFEPIRRSLLDPLVKDVATRVMAHQDRTREHRDKFLG